MARPQTEAHAVTSLVSVVSPTHNRAESLARAAASVLTQNIAELELVVVDDCSTDATPDVLDRLTATEPRVRVVRNNTALGPCEARNGGLAVARGDFVGFCDDDYAWVPEWAKTWSPFSTRTRSSVACRVGTS